MSISVTITVTAAEGKFEEFRDKLLANLPVTKEFEGLEALRLIAPNDPSDTLVLIEEWSSVDAYNAYKAFRAESGTSALKPELIAGPPNVVFGEILF